MEEADQEFEDLLHGLNLPGPLWVPVRSLPGSAPIRLTWRWWAAHVEDRRR
jgi:hypothetical protein